jgi:hypothetical protein
MSPSNNYTQKEIIEMIFKKLDDIEKKLDTKLDKSEFYKVLTLAVAIGGVVAAIIM